VYRNGKLLLICARRCILLFLDLLFFLTSGIFFLTWPRVIFGGLRLFPRTHSRDQASFPSFDHTECFNGCCLGTRDVEASHTQPGTSNQLSWRFSQFPPFLLVWYRFDACAFGFPHINSSTPSPTRPLPSPPRAS